MAAYLPDPDSGRTSFSSTHDSVNGGIEEARSEIWKTMSRDGYPVPKQQEMPWKDFGLAPTYTKPADNGLFGHAWKKVIVAVAMIVDLGTGST